MGYKLNHPKHKEYMIFPDSKKDIKIIEDQFHSVSQKYIGHIKDISNKLKDSNIELKNLENELKITKLQYTNDLLQKDLIIQQKNSEYKLLEKDLLLANKKIKKLKNKLSLSC